ncbi:MAG: hypothetical protein ACMUIA_03360 [bacterium]
MDSKTGEKRTDNYFQKGDTNMSRKLFTLFILGCPFFLITTLHPAFGGMVPYEKGTPTTIEGRIMGVHTTPNPVVSELGLHLTVETKEGEYIVHVSPQWYADQQQFQFVKGEYLTITGSFFLRDQQKNIYAATLVRRFSALSREQQIRLASEAVSSPDLQALAAKYAVDLEEVEFVEWEQPPIEQSLEKEKGL